MARLPDWADESEVQAWLATRPAVIQAMAKRVRPGYLYRHAETGRLVWVYSYEEDGTLTIVVEKQYNSDVLFERRVFGVRPEHLVECDLPMERES